MKHSLISTIFIAGLALIYSCTSSPQSGFEVTNGKVVGKIFDEDLTPATGATVYYVNTTHDPYSGKDTPVDSTVTDATGNYSFKSMQRGFYNVLARKGTKASYLDSIFINDNGVIQEVNDTLEKAVVCKGIVRLQNHEADNSSAIVLVLGTNTYTMAKDTAGTFELPPLPPGTYHLRILTTNTDYPAKDTTISLEPGQTTRIIDTLTLFIGGIPKVGPVTAIYNERLMTATLSWPRIDQSINYSYHVERIENGPSLLKKRTLQIIADDFVPENTTSSSETTFVDYCIPESGAIISYVVSAVNSKGQQGGFSDTIKVTATSKLQLVSSIPLHDFQPEGWINDVQIVKGGDIYLLQNSTDGDSIFRFDSTGTILNKFACIAYPWPRSFCIGSNGDIYLFTTRDGGRIIRMNGNFEVLKEHPVLPGTIIINAKMTTGTDGTIYFYDNPTNVSLVIAYSPDLTEKNRWQLDNTVLDFQILEDRIIGYDYGASTDDNVVIRYYSSDFAAEGAVDITTGIKQYRFSHPEYLDSKFYKGENGISVLFYGAYFSSFNEYTARYDVLFFNSDNTLSARARLKGRVVKITKAGDIYWFTDNTLLRCRLTDG